MPDSGFIALIRHGDYHQPADVPSALLPHPLTDAGEQQAAAAAADIRAFADSRGLTVHPQVDCSRMLRAWQTARMIGDGLETSGLGPFSVHEHEALAERSVGAAANLTVQEIEAILERDPRHARPPSGWKSSTDYCLPLQGAESLLAAGQRVAGHISRVASGLDDTMLKLIVGHGASIRHAAMELGVLTREGVSAVSMHHAKPVFVRMIGGKWTHVDGAWKPRKTGADSDEYANATIY